MSREEPSYRSQAAAVNIATAAVTWSPSARPSTLPCRRPSTPLGVSPFLV
jgi:hypothetical protein